MQHLIGIGSGVRNDRTVCIVCGFKVSPLKVSLICCFLAVKQSVLNVLNVTEDSFLCPDLCMICLRTPHHSCLRSLLLAMGFVRFAALCIFGNIRQEAAKMILPNWDVTEPYILFSGWRHCFFTQWLQGITRYLFSLYECTYICTEGNNSLKTVCISHDKISGENVVIYLIKVSDPNYDQIFPALNINHIFNTLIFL